MSSLQSRAGVKFAPPGPFARELTRRAHEAMKLVDGGRYGDGVQWLCALGALCVGVAAYGLLLSGHFGSASGSALIAIAALSAFMLIVQVGHDAAHGSVSPRRWINDAIVYIVFALLGVDGAMWRDRHIRLHHHVANLPGTGIDADSVSVMRLAPDKPLRWWHRFQPIYGPLLYALGHLHLVWVEDIRGFLLGRATARNKSVKRPSVALFLSGKAIHVAVFLVLPGIMLNPPCLLLVLGYVFASVLVAICFVILVVGTHVSDRAAFPIPNEAGELSHDWATHQIITSIDWSPTSHVAALLSGGANAHVAHHLFPGVNHRHMPILSQVVARVAADHGVPYEVTSFAGMVVGHWRHLVRLGTCQGSQA